MCKEGRSIYQNSRLGAGMTQEVAAERLHISIESIGAYERSETRIPCDLVARMAELYQDPMLAFDHLTKSCPVGKDCLPAVVQMDAPTAILTLKKEIADVSDMDRQMISAALDGSISRLDGFKNEIRKMISVGLSILTIGIKKRNTRIGVPGAP